MEFKHISVLKDESIAGLEIKPDGVYVDCTTGGGGHSLEIAKCLTTGRLICFDKDTDALVAAKERLKDHLDKITFVNRNFLDIDEVLEELGIDAVDGILADLGVSSYQLDTAERGFSFRA
ncbi:MAG: 16S rRNA (cytosine(1402)-N(4))-methyltransferase, partial [Clostridia bacterium]|nr:16S rRNA (cytosine(1402)-N(4))-methyltransferase [Clostridia bacterium]